jgi:hypothetical protein
MHDDPTLDSIIRKYGLKRTQRLVEEMRDCGREFEVTCVDNANISESFDQGERYMAVRVEGAAATRIAVFDVYGHWIQCDADKFERT